MEITDEELNNAFGNINVNMLVFIVLSALPVGGVVSSHYGTIERISDLEFKLTPAEDISMDDIKEDMYDKNKAANDSIMELFK